MEKAGGTIQNGESMVIKWDVGMVISLDLLVISPGILWDFMVFQSELRGF